MYKMTLVCGVVVCAASADPEIFNSPSPGANDETRIAWLTACGIKLPQHLVDFETGFVEDQNVSGKAIFPGGLLITDTSPDGQAIIESGSIGGSNPIGTYAVEHNEEPYLELSFVEPVDYVGMYDIDQAGSSVIVTFADESTYSFTIDTTASGGNSAEFLGIWRAEGPKITSVEIDASGDGAWALDNIQFGVVGGCVADCNADGQLNILDFVCFQGRFTKGDPAADCNGDGVLNILDFVCFQQLFQAGCP